MSNTKIYNFIFKHNYNTNYHRNCLILYLDKKKIKKKYYVKFFTDQHVPIPVFQLIFPHWIEYHSTIAELVEEDNWYFPLRHAC